MRRRLVGEVLATTRSRIRSGRTQCSAYIDCGMRSCAATEALLLFMNVIPSASVAPAAVTSTLTDGPSRMR